MHATSALCLRAWLVVGLCCLAGCGSSRDAEFVKAANDTNIKKMCNAYLLYSSWTRYTGPKSKEEFKRFLKTDQRITENLKVMELDRENVDDYFVSENDGEEFEFRWGVFINPDQQRFVEPLVFEKNGKDGVRLVMLSNLKILEVDNDRQYKRLLKGKVGREDAKTDLEREEEAEDFESPAVESGTE